MVKVLPCHNFKSQKVLCPKAEPIAIYCSQDLLFVATQKSFIEVYRVTEEEETCVCCFQTLGVVHDLLHSPCGDYVVTVESGNARETPLTTHVLAYRKWREWSVGASVRLVSLNSRGTVLPETTEPTIPSAASGNFAHDAKLSFSTSGDDSGLKFRKMPQDTVGNYFEAVQVSSADGATRQSIAVDNETGTLAVGNKFKVSLYRYEIEERENVDGNLDDVHLRCLLELTVSFTVTELSICEEFILCRSESEVQVVQLRLVSDSCLEDLRTLLMRRSPVYVKYKDSLDFVSDYLTDDWLSASSRRKTVAKKRGGVVGSCNTESIILDDGCVNIMESMNIDLNGLAQKWLSTRRRFSDNGEDHRNVIEGPIQNHPRCSAFIAYSDPRLVFRSAMESDLLTNLFRRFETREITSSQLFPIYCQSEAEESSSAASDDCGGRGLLSAKRGLLLAVMCLVSTDTEGYLYLVGGRRTRLIQTYNYTTQGTCKASLGYDHLYVSTRSGIEIYSVDAVAKAAYDAGIRDQTISFKQREACMVGIQPFVSVHAMSLSSNHVCVLSKVTEGEGGADSEAFWSIYILQMPCPMDTYQDIHELCEFHKTRSDVLYAYLLEEMYYSLRGLCLIQDKTNVQQTETRLSEIALSLAELCSGMDSTEWKNAVPYYLVSERPIDKILPQGTDTAPGKGLWNYLDFILFHAEELELEESVSGRVLRMYVKWRSDVLTHALLTTNLLSKFSDDTIKYLRVEMEDTLKAVDKEQYHTYLLGLCIVCLHLSDTQTTENLLSSFKQDKLVELCVEFPRLLLDTNNHPTTLTVLIQRVHPSAVTGIFVPIIENRKLTLESVADMFNHLRVKDNHLHSPLFVQILEKLACDNKNSALFAQIIPLLLETYLSQLVAHDMKGMEECQTKYIIPKKGGLFSNRFVWLDEIPPLQGTVALTKECENTESTGADGRTRACPCTSCNATLLKLQCLLCSSEITETNMRLVLQQLESIPVDGVDSIRIQCLLTVDMRECINLLMSKYAELIPSIIDQAVRHGRSKIMESVGFIFDVLAEDQQFHLDKKSTESILLTVSELLEPEEFIRLVSKYNRLNDCAQFIRNSVRSYQAGLLRERISEHATLLLADIQH